jgi:hypothetical protein
VIVNAVRISIALWLAAHPVSLSTLSAADVHRLEGIVVIRGLWLLYELVRRVDRGVPASGLYRSRATTSSRLRRADLNGAAQTARCVCSMGRRSPSSHPS